MSHIRGRFGKEAASAAQDYTASIPFDIVLYRYDILGSLAHVKMLAKQGIVTAREAEVIAEALFAISEEIEGGEFNFKPELEDIHMNIESRLIEKVGDEGRKLHTARSRNDQVALDMRLFVKDSILDAVDGIRELQEVLLGLAEENKGVVMPGYTHLQPAQPVLFAHHMLAYFEMLQRDIERFNACMARVDVLPLGSGALAGVPYDIDRDFLAKELGFSKVSRNSMDAVSDRDFVIEYEAAASIAMMHLSRLAEELILWSSAEFSFIEIDDAYATGSSIMPQKKNPDVAELARGRTGRVYGRLMAMLATMKALPLSYNRDMQEDKEGLFDTVDTLLSTLEVFCGMMDSVKVRGDAMEVAVARGYLLATDIADYLVAKGEPFRSAHEVVAGLVAYAAETGKKLEDLTIAEYSKFSPLFGEDVLSIEVRSSLAARDVTGGTAPKQVNCALARAKRVLKGGRGGK